MRIFHLALLAITSISGDAFDPSTHALRQEFIQKMGDVQGRRLDANVQRKLLKVAKSVEPEFMKPRLLDENENEEENDAEEDGEEEYDEFAIDLSEYALKYIGCSNIHTYSDELAQNAYAESILEMNRFVVLRLCPKKDCSNYYSYGCQSKFGDYLIEMEAYLQIMAENYFNQYKEYCETCHSCMHPNAANDDQYGWQNNGYYGWNDYQLDDDGAANCRYQDVCTNYWSACKDYKEEAYELEEFFECSKFNMGDTFAYLGPHCNDDGKTIGIAVYSDGYCNDYSKDLKEVSSYLDIDMTDSSEYLKPFHSKTCISCLASEGYSLDANADDDGVSDICYAIYDEAAKCNKYIGNDGDINSDVQEENEDTVCNFIHNIVTGTYDEYGEIYLGGSGLKTYVTYISKSTPAQQWALVISILLVLGLASYALYLHRSVTTNKFKWVSRRGYSNEPGANPSKFGRDHSGIMSGRSFDKGFLA